MAEHNITIHKSFREYGGKQWATYENGAGVTVQVWKDQQLSAQHDLSYADYAVLREKAPHLKLREYPNPALRRKGGTNANGNTIGRLVGETAAAEVPAKKSNPPVKAETPEEQDLGTKILDGVQLGLDIAGLVPGFGEIADLANAGISLARGDYVGAALSLVAAIPLAGWFGAAGKAARRGAKAVASKKLVKETTERTSKEVAEKEARKAARKQAKEKSGGKIIKKKLEPGTPEHKADRWQKYQERGGQKEYDSWSKQYNTNMRNYQYGAAREAKYREVMGASEGTIKTPLTNRQIDILKKDEMYAGQLKTGPVSLTKDNALTIAKDGELVKRGWKVEHILEQGASKPYLDALKRAGIDYKLVPQIP